MELSLFDRLGGSAAIYAAVELFYIRVLDDQKLAPLFAGADMSELKKHQRDYFTMALGGPNGYEGQHLTDADSHMVKTEGVSDEHFDAVAGHLEATLEELDVPSALIAEVMDIVGSRRDAIFRRVEGQKAA